MECSKFGDGKSSSRFMDFSEVFESFLYFCATYVGCMQGGGIFDFTMMDYSIELFLLECFENKYVLREDNYCNYVIISIIF